MELARLAIGFVVAITVPMSVPRLRASYFWALLFVVTYAAYSAFPVLNALRATLICLLAGLVALAFLRRRRVAAETKAAAQGAPEAAPAAPPKSAALQSMLTTATLFYRTYVRRVDRAAILILIVIAIFLASDLYHPGSLATLIQDDRVALISSAALLAVFAGNELVLLVIGPYLRALSAEGEDIKTIIPTGLHIGWIERMIVFSFIAAGQPEAAALAVAAKSVIRIPEVSKHAGVYGQYVLVGTLANLLVAMLAAIAARIFIGLPPL